MNSLTGPKRRRRLILTAMMAGMAAFLLSYAFAELDINGTLHTGLTYDVGPYSDIAESVFGGATPYVDFTFEHLPAMLIPILGLGWLSDLSGLSPYFVWPMAMTGLFTLTAVLVDAISPQHDKRAAPLGASNSSIRSCTNGSSMGGIRPSIRAAAIP